MIITPGMILSCEVDLMANQNLAGYPYNIHVTITIIPAVLFLVDWYFRMQGPVTHKTIYIFFLQYYTFWY